MLLELSMYKTIKYRIISILYEGPRLWNTVNNDIKITRTLPQFKSKLTNWYGKSCNLYVLHKLLSLVCILNIPISRVSAIH